MLDPKYTKPVNAVISSESETSSIVVLTGHSLQYSLCVRSSTTTNRGNYFVSVNLPTVSSKLPTGSTISLLYPELQQLNVEKIIICQIPNTAYTEYIDARSIVLDVPVIINSAATSYRLYSSTYSSNQVLKYGESSPLLGDNIAFLFSDNINRPYTGYTSTDMGMMVSHSAVTTWNPSSDIDDRTAAVSYLEVQGNRDTINTDKRTNGSYAVGVPNGYPSYIGYSTSYNYDVPVGFISLDKGLIVLTHTAITSNFGWTNGLTPSGGTYAGVTDDDKHKIRFTSNSRLEFADLNTELKISAVCMALNGEFYVSNNPTWDRNVGRSEFADNNAVYLTEIGLYNALGEQIGIGKFSEPVRRVSDDIFTFYINIEM